MGIEGLGGSGKIDRGARFISKPLGFFRMLGHSDSTFRLSLGMGRQFHEFLRVIPDFNPLHGLLKLTQKTSMNFSNQLEHTYTTLFHLDTDGLNLEMTKKIVGASRSLRELVRIAALYHDIGKVKGAYDREHPSESARMAGTLLKDPARSGVGELNDVDIDFVSLLIEHHHLPGDLAGEYAAGGFGMVSALSRVEAALGSVRARGLSLKDGFLVLSKVSDADIISNFGENSKELKGKNEMMKLLSVSLMNAETILANMRASEGVEFGLGKTAPAREDKGLIQGTRQRKPGREKAMEDQAARKAEIDRTRAVQQERKEADAFERNLAGFVLSRTDKFQVVRITFKIGSTTVSLFDEKDMKEPIDERTCKGPLAKAFREAGIAKITFRGPYFERREIESVKKIFDLALGRNLGELKDIEQMGVAES